MENKKLQDGDLINLNRPNLSQAALDIITHAEENGISVDELLKTANIELNVDGPRIPVDNRSLTQEEIDEFARLNSKQKVIPGQSLTADPAAPKPWETPPEFPNPKDALENVVQRLYQPENIKAVAQTLKAGASVTNIVETLLYTDYLDGKYTPDVMMLIYEPTLYAVINIGESANLNYRIDGTENVENFDTEGLAKEENNNLNAFREIKKQVLNKPNKLEGVSEELKEELNKNLEKGQSLLAQDRKEEALNEALQDSEITSLLQRKIKGENV